MQNAVAVIVLIKVHVNRNVEIVILDQNAILKV
jgi:hypothetical protein